MTSKFVRVTAKHIVRDGSEPMPKIQFDLKIDDETKAVLGKWKIFCVFGSYKEDGQDIHPFVLHEDGRVDYGTDWEEGRFGETNIREAILAEKINLGGDTIKLAEASKDLAKVAKALEPLSAKTVY